MHEGLLTLTYKKTTAIYGRGSNSLAVVGNDALNNGITLQRRKKVLTDWLLESGVYTLLIQQLPVDNIWGREIRNNIVIGRWKNKIKGLL